MRSLQLLCTVGGDLASPCTERNNIFLERGGGEAGRAYHCKKICKYYKYRANIDWCQY